MDDQIETLENKLRLYMNTFCELVQKSTKIDTEGEDVSILASKLKDSHRKMVEIVDTMKQIDETEEQLFQTTKSYDRKNEEGIAHLKFIDREIEHMDKEVELSISSIVDLNTK